MSAIRYLPLLVFQLVVAVLFFVFVKYDGDKHHDFRGYEDAHVMIYIGFGYLMTFLKRYAYGALGFNWLLAALVAQWSIITQGIFHLDNMKIKLSKETLFEADVMAATVLITFGALLGRSTPGQLLFIAIIEAFVGSLNIYVVTDVLKAADVGGSMAIHAYGAFFGIGVSAAWINVKQWGEREMGHVLEGPSYISDVTSLIGSIFLYIYWPSFNAALAGTDADYQRAICNTYLAIASCSVVTFVLSAFVSHGKFEMEHVQNSTLAGGVGVGSVCNMHITSGGAIMIGIGAAFVSVFGFKKLKPFFIAKFGILDTCGVMHLHGFPGVYSGLLSILFAALATSDTYTKDGLGTVFPAMKGANARSATSQALYQLIALVMTMVVGFFAGLITGVITRLNIFLPLRRDEKFNDEKFWEVP